MGNSKGTALVTGLLVVLLLTILSLVAMISTGTELKIASNDRSAKEAFYIAESGLDDARSRLQITSPSPITDTLPTNINWRAFIGNVTKCQGMGYQSANSNHWHYDQLNPPNMDYAVWVRHKVNASNQILLWGDANNDGKAEENTTVGRNIYVIHSQGYTATGASKAIQIDAAKPPPITAPAALYTKENTIIQSNAASTIVSGMDHCGGSSVYGLVTMVPTVEERGGPLIEGVPQGRELSSEKNVDVQYLIDQYKNLPTTTKLDWSGTHSNQQWGIPNNPPPGSQNIASTCSERNFVYINTNSTYVQLQASGGCGLLMVEGDLNLHGAFSWYGVILVTGSLSFTGGGEKNVTGAILAAGTSSTDIVGGNANILFCSTAVNYQTDSLPLITLRWAELFN